MRLQQNKFTKLLKESYDTIVKDAGVKSTVPGLSTANEIVDLLELKHDWLMIFPELMDGEFIDVPLTVSVKANEYEDEDARIVEVTLTGSPAIVYRGMWEEILEYEDPFSSGTLDSGYDYDLEIDRAYGCSIDLAFIVYMDE